MYTSEFTHSLHCGVEHVDDDLLFVQHFGGVFLEFRKAGGKWTVQGGEVGYFLEEDADHYYLMDPTGPLVLTFEKMRIRSDTSTVGALVRIEDRNGSAITVTNLQASDFYVVPTKYEDDSGRSLQLQYVNPSESWTYPHLSRVTDQAGRQVSFEFDVDQAKWAVTLTTVTDTEGATYRHTHTGRRLTEWRDESANTQASPGPVPIPNDSSGSENNFGTLPPTPEMANPPVIPSVWAILSGGR